MRHEREDLLADDIPMFTTRPESTDLFPSIGEPIRNFFDEPAIDCVRRRILRMDEQDLARKVDLIKSAFAKPVFDA